jgi:predicted NBD/HSP70 family sugar kinase
MAMRVESKASSVSVWWCRSGGRCLDTVASGWSVVRDLGPAWWHGPPTDDTRRRAHQAGVAVGQAVHTAISILDPTRVVVAGHIAGRTDFVEGFVSVVESDTSDRHYQFTPDTWNYARRGFLRVALGQVESSGSQESDEIDRAASIPGSEAG